MRILGYNSRRPTAEKYHDFERKLTSGLKDLGIDGFSLMIYGSYVRGDCNYGRSDIDAVMTFPDNVVIDKRNLHNASLVLRRALTGNNVPFQVTVTDIATMRDKRFNSFDPSFEKYFDGEARITGTDYRDQFTYALPTMNDQGAVRFNLRKARTGLLFAQHDMHEDYELFLNKFHKSLEATSRGSKQVLSFADGIFRANRFSALEIIEEDFPEVNPEPLKRIKRLFQNFDELDELYKNPEEVLSLWNSAVNFFEELIRAYMMRYTK